MFWKVQLSRRKMWVVAAALPCSSGSCLRSRPGVPPRRQGCEGPLARGGGRCSTSRRGWARAGRGTGRTTTGESAAGASYQYYTETKILLFFRHSSAAMHGMKTHFVAKIRGVLWARSLSNWKMWSKIICLHPGPMCVPVSVRGREKRNVE
jgi:hypothetical protein